VEIVAMWLLIEKPKWASYI